VRIEKLGREYDIRVEYVNFPLHPDTPPNGISLAERFGPDALPRLRESQKQLKQLAQTEGLPLTDRTMTYNSRLAQELGVWATSKGKGPEFHMAAFHAYFVDGRNIHDLAVLVDLAKEAGLDPREAARIIAERRYKDAVDKEWSDSEAAGIEAVPTFEAGGRRVVGAQPYEELARLLESAGAKKRKQDTPR
jgi:predicted DsbA family dithiol-disulfide isomerase